MSVHEPSDEELAAQLQALEQEMSATQAQIGERERRRASRAAALVVAIQQRVTDEGPSIEVSSNGRHLAPSTYTAQAEEIESRLARRQTLLDILVRRVRRHGSVAEDAESTDLTEAPDQSEIESAIRALGYSNGLLETARKTPDISAYLGEAGGFGISLKRRLIREVNRWAASCRENLIPSVLRNVPEPRDNRPLQNAYYEGHGEGVTALEGLVEKDQQAFLAVIRDNRGKAAKAKIGSLDLLSRTVEPPLMAPEEIGRNDLALILMGSAQIESLRQESQTLHDTADTLRQVWTEELTVRGMEASDVDAVADSVVARATYELSRSGVLTRDAARPTGDLDR